MQDRIRLHNLQRRLRARLKTSNVEPDILCLIEEVEKITNKMLADRENDG